MWYTVNKTGQYSGKNCCIFFCSDEEWEVLNNSLEHDIEINNKIENTIMSAQLFKEYIQRCGKILTEETAIYPTDKEALSKGCTHKIFMSTDDCVDFLDYLFELLIYR